MANETENRLMFGGKDNTRSWIYCRYAMGDPVSVIASEADMSEAKVLEIMRELPKEHEQTKKLREAFMGLRVQRSLSLVDAHNLRVLEALAEGTIDEGCKPEVIKELGKMAKCLADRVRLYEGKATQIIRVDDEELSVDDLKARLTELEAAGDGLAKT
jgi:DNA-binding Lrp family transcriptional regulator